MIRKITALILLWIFGIGLTIGLAQQTVQATNNISTSQITNMKKIKIQRSDDKALESVAGVIVLIIIGTEYMFWKSNHE